MHHDLKKKVKKKVRQQKNINFGNLFNKFLGKMIYKQFFTSHEREKQTESPMMISYYWYIRLKNLLLVSY